MAAPTVTIVTATLNQSVFLESTVRSVLDQTYPHIEYIVMDGGSTDGSVDIIRRYANRLAHWQSGTDGGFSAAIADGFQRASGDILAWLNSDDLLAPDAVEHAVHALEHSPKVDLVYGNRVCIDELGRLLYYKCSLPIGATSPYAAFIVPQETCFWRHKAYLAVGGMNRDLCFAIDYDLFSRLSQRSRFAYVPGIWGFFRKHPNSKTIRQYQTLGKQEGRFVQETVWGRVPARFAWLSILMFAKAWGSFGMLLRQQPHWPYSLDPTIVAPWRERMRRSFPRDSPVERLLRALRLVRESDSNNAS